MLTAYFDDSGTSPTDPVAVVAGYLASARMWNRFNEQWESLLRKYEITKVHRAELENFKGEFANWKPARRTEFVKKAHAIIRRCTYVGVGLALIKDDLKDEIPKDTALAQFEIFSWCAHGCLAGIRSWCDDKKHQEHVEYVFEAGTEGQNQFHRTMEVLYKDSLTRAQNRIQGWSFQGKETAPLQAADIIAYEFYKFIKNEVVDKHKRGVRLSARDLFRPQDVRLLKNLDQKTFKRFRDKWQSNPEDSVSSST